MELQDLSKDPNTQFQRWLQDAELHSGMEYPNSMSLSTVSADGRPSSRIVLLKGVSSEGYLFYTNYEGRKGKELDQNPAAALCFYWDKQIRQVRIEGLVKKISREESQSYFSTRPRGSQIGAWASPQSQEIPSRQFLDDRVDEIQKRFLEVDPIPVPPFWGGYALKPDRFEFWQGGLNRLHDRFEYALEKGKWKIRRLAP